jgi:creatinine amidohydrolase
MAHESRPYVLLEATYRQMLDFRPNVAVLPWGATEAHNYHLPHGTDVIEATSLGEEAVRRACDQGGKCVLLPCVPFGINHTQLDQVATISMRAATQQAVLHDVAQSLVAQGIDRLVLLNFHGGNEFKSMIRDVMLDVPIFIVQVHGWQTAPVMRDLLDDPGGDHADEFETSYMLHVAPQFVAPLESAGDGAATPSKLPAVSNTPGVWVSRQWSKLTRSTGVGDPRAATAEKGQRIFELLVEALVPILVQLSSAKPGDFPFVINAQDRI